MDGSSSLPGCDLAKMTGSIRFLYYSLSYVNLFKDRLSLSLSFLGVCFVRKSGCKGTAFFNTLQMFRKKSSQKLAVFRVVLQNKGKKRAFGGKRQEKGDILGTRPPCHGGGLGGKTGPYRGKTMPWRGETRAGEQRKWGEADGNKSLLRLGSYFLLIIYSVGKAKVAVVGKSTPSCPLGGGPKPIAHPSGWSRDGFGMEGGTRTSGFLMQDGENGAFPPTRDGCIHSLSMRERG